MKTGSALTVARKIFRSAHGANSLPRRHQKVRRGDHLDLVALHIHRVTDHRDRLAEATVYGVEFEQVLQRLRMRDIYDRADLDVGAGIEEAKDIPPDPPKTHNSNIPAFHYSNWGGALS